MDWTTLKTKGALLSALEALPQGSRQEPLLEYLAQQVADIQKSDVPNPDQLRQNFVAIGFDSLQAIELLYRLGRDLNRSLDPDLLEQEDLESLAIAVLNEVWPQ